MSRLIKLRQLIIELKIDGLLINNPENRRYMSGFSGSAGALLVGPEIAFLVTDFRYWEQVLGEATEFELWKQGPNFWQSVSDALRKCGWQRVGFESDSLTFEEYRTLTDLLPEVEFIPYVGMVEKLRQTKEESEVLLITKAARITDQAWQKTLDRIKPGVAEREIALEFDYQLRLHGADGSAFTTIVASGWRAALPHGAASDKKLLSGDLLIIDGGALFQGYHADMTRTVVVGQASDRQKEIYHIVLHAQQIALESLKAGVSGKNIDQIARDYIREQGFGDYFGHGLGHSVGLNIHENPRLSMTEPGIIPSGAVVTVEPGIYLPQWGGVRIEDLVVVSETGIQNLTGSPKEQLIEI